MACLVLQDTLVIVFARWFVRCGGTPGTAPGDCLSLSKRYRMSAASLLNPKHAAAPLPRYTAPNDRLLAVHSDLTPPRVHFVDLIHLGIIRGR
jgi:hypothetical protein